MRKFLSMILCISMLLSLTVFVPTVTSAATNTDATPESTRNALELFGFPLDPDSYDTQALKKGTYPVAPKYDLYVDNADKIKKYPTANTAVYILPHKEQCRQILLLFLFEGIYMVFGRPYDLKE